MINDPDLEKYHFFYEARARNQERFRITHTELQDYIDTVLKKNNSRPHSARSRFSAITRTGAQEKEYYDCEKVVLT